MKIIDCFIFYNEFELLEARLHELYPVIDHFILVEATKTFTGLDKELLFEKNKERYTKYLDKIIHIVVSEFPETDNPWIREKFQRNAVMRGLTSLQLDDNDIIFLSDSDEIFNRELMLNIRNGSLVIENNKLYRLGMTLYYYSLEWQSPRIWNLPYACLYSYLKVDSNPDKFRHPVLDTDIIIPNCGWHISYYGDTNFIKNKLKSYSETQTNTDRNNNNDYLINCINNGKLFFDINSQVQLHYVPLLTNNNLPKYYSQKNIPLIAFTFWEGSQLSWLHNLTIQTFIKHNPEFELRIYYSSKEENFIHGNESNHIVNNTHVSGVNIESNKCINIEQIQNLPGVKLIPIDLEKRYGIEFITSPIHKADIVRIIKLYEHGGVWFDFDVFFTKPIPTEIIHSTADIQYYTYSNTIATGLIISRPFNKAIRHVYNTCLEKINTRNINNDWQQFGPTLWANCVFNNTSIFKDCIFRDNNEIYPYLYYEPQLFFRTMHNKLTDKTWSIHWYNGNTESRKFINEFNISDIKPDRSIFENELIKFMK